MRKMYNKDKKGMFMNQDHVSELPIPGEKEREKLLQLIGKVIINNDHVYTQEDIELARELADYQWRVNVADFLAVIAGIAHPGEEVDEAYSALVFPVD